MKQNQERIYQWAGGGEIAQQDANIVGPELDRIKEESNGVIVPEKVVEYARKKQSPMHNCFDWDDVKVAHEFRIIQAKMIISSIRIISHQSDDTTVKQLAFVPYKTTEQNGYIDAKVAAANMDTRQFIIQLAAGKIDDIQRKMRLFKDLCDEADALRGIVKKLKKKRNR
jgi:hypothetical protein